MGYLLHYRFVQGEELRQKRSGWINDLLGETAGRILFTSVLLFLIAFVLRTVRDGFEERRTRLELKRAEERGRERERAARAKDAPWDTTVRERNE